MGQFGETRSAYFIDLLTASHNKRDRMCLATVLAEVIRRSFSLERFDYLVVPKLGNCLLSIEVAQGLSKSLLFVRNNILFGEYIEGPYLRGKRAVLIDDIASSGEQTYTSILNLRNSGICPVGVAVIINRSEGTARDLMQRESIRFESCVSFTEEKIREIYPTSAKSY